MERDAGRRVAIRFSRVAVVVSDEREKETVGGRARPGKVWMRMLTLCEESML